MKVQIDSARVEAIENAILEKEKRKPVTVDVIQCLKCGSKITKRTDSAVICTNCYWFVKEILYDLEDAGVEVPKTRHEKANDKLDKFDKFIFNVLYDHDLKEERQLIKTLSDNTVKLYRKRLIYHKNDISEAIELMNDEIKLRKV
jgi:hypothetical protein